MHLAAQENRDVKIAAERLRAARSGVTVSRSFLAPSVSAVGSASDRSSGYGDAVKQQMPDTRNGSAGLDVAWEVDLSGRLRAGAAAAAADALAAEHGVRGVRLLVMTDVASNYFTLVGALRQLDTLRAISAAHDETAAPGAGRAIVQAWRRRSTWSARRPTPNRHARRSRRWRRSRRSRGIASRC